MDDLTKKVASAIKENAGESNRAEEQQGIAVNGNGNIIGNGNVVVTTEKIIHRPRVFVTPGAGVITSQQAATLYKLVHEIAALERIARKAPCSYGVIWNAVNSHCGVSAYKEIPLDKFDFAEKYLRRWLGRLSSGKTAKKKDPGWRKRKLAFIHTNIKKFNMNDKLRQLLYEKYGVASMTEISDDDLAKVYSVVSGWKQAHTT